MDKKKKFRDTKLGKFLSKTAPAVLDVAGDLLPDKGVLGIVKNLISKDANISPEDKEIALKLLEQDMVEMQEVSKRWSSDMTSDSWLSKNTRPMALIFLTISMIIFMLLDSFDWGFQVELQWVDLLKSLLVTVYVAYFGSRGVEKFKAINNKR